MEVILTKKSPGDWPELEGKGNMTPTIPQRADTVEKKEPSVGTSRDAAAKVPRPYSSSKNWDVVSDILDDARRVVEALQGIEQSALPRHP